MRILVGGIGNVLSGDDGFGVEVIRRLAERGLPECVEIVNFGIRGMDLVSALLDEYERVILVDAVPHGGAPGSLYVIESVNVRNLVTTAETPVLDTHSMDPIQVMRLAVALGGGVDHVTLVGCEPLHTATGPGVALALSPPVADAVPEAVERIVALLSGWVANAGSWSS